MGYFRTAILLAALTALFMAIGYLVGGQSGMVVAFLVAAAMNLFAYWKSDKLVLSMYSAHEGDGRVAPELYGLVGQTAREADCRCRRSTSWTIDCQTPSRGAQPRACRRRCHDWAFAEAEQG